MRLFTTFAERGGIVEQLSTPTSDFKKLDKELDKLVADGGEIKVGAKGKEKTVKYDRAFIVDLKSQTRRQRKFR